MREFGYPYLRSVSTDPGVEDLRPWGARRANGLMEGKKIVPSLSLLLPGILNIFVMFHILIYLWYWDKTLKKGLNLTHLNEHTFDVF